MGHNHMLPIVGSLLSILALANAFVQPHLNLNHNEIDSFSRRLRSLGAAARRSAPSFQMCICVNCKWVDTCKAYHWVETKHQQPHLTMQPDFMPRDGSPTMQAFIRQEGQTTPDHLADRGITVEYDIVGCEDFVEEKGRWIKMMPKGSLLDAGFDPDFVPT